MIHLVYRRSCSSRGGWGAAALWLTLSDGYPLKATGAAPPPVKLMARQAEGDYHHQKIRPTLEESA